MKSPAVRLSAPRPISKPNDPTDPNYHDRLVATDGRSVRIQLGGKRVITADGSSQIAFIADGPLSEPPDAD
ncbi:MAG: hypothetical protein IH849_11005 [Acidobacteria bacterium]|nr:hypothetical protein [Acidobacteriota bacterium]